jgi:small subunit ribosomal protein S20
LKTKPRVVFIAPVCYICTPFREKEELRTLRMANHKSAIKRIRANRAKMLRNRFQLRSTRSAIKRLRGIEDKTEAQTFFRQVTSMIDKLAKRNIIHKNQAANRKGKLARAVSAMA